MAIGGQFQKIKDNWLIFVLVFLVLGASGVFNSIVPLARYSSSNYAGSASYDMQKSYAPYVNNRDFAPDEQDRKILKTVSMSTEVERGKYTDEESRLKSIITSSNSFLLTENVNRYGDENNVYKVGYYSIKVDVKKYDAVVTELKAIGKIKSFAENREDITGQYKDAQIELAAEKARLDRYNQMLKEATLVADKIVLNDRIFDQERTIKYMQQNIDTMDKTVEYSTIDFTMSEKQSEFSNIVFVRLSELVSSLVASLNAMITLIFVLVPWLVLGGIAFLLARLRK